MSNDAKTATTAGHAYNSCRNRHCPKCQGAAARDWLAARQADLLPVGYFHLVFTLPAEIADIAYHNKAVIYDLLFRASSEAMLTIAADPKHLGARIGITAVLHSWGSAMTHHPHVHMIVPGGGISPDGTTWVHCRSGFLLPVRVLSRLFRRLMLSRLADAHQSGRLAFFGDQSHLGDPRAFAALLAPLWAKDWFVYAKPPFAGPEAVLAYLSRYTHRVAIANNRLGRPQSVRRDLPIQGLPPQRTPATEDNDARAGRVHPALSPPRPAKGLPSHSSLRPAGQCVPQGQYRTRPRTSRRPRTGDGAQQCRHRHNAGRPSAAMPVLRRTHDHRRDLRARRPTPRPATPPGVQE